MTEYTAAPAASLGLRELVTSRPMLVTLGLLLAADLAFLGLHATQVLAEWRAAAPLPSGGFNIEAEGSHAELYEIAKAVLCVASLGLCTARTGQPVYAALAAAFGIALADNALMLHERMGGALAPLLGAATAMFHSAPQALGELAFFALAGAVILLLLGVGFSRSLGPHRRAGTGFVLLLAALGGFGVVLDLVHAVLSGQRRAVDRVLGALEDGGELVVLSVATALAIALAARLAMPRRPF